jgi:hypothetical protein
MTRFVCWCVVMLLLAGLAAVAADLMRLRRQAGLDMPSFSVYSDADDGLGEAASVLRKLGWTPVALTRSVQPARHRGLLVVVEPGGPRTRPTEDEGLTDADAEVLLRWVSEGNTLLLCTDRNTPLHQALGMLVHEDAEPDPAFTSVTLEDVGSYTAGIEQMSVGTRATLQAGPDALPLWRLGDRPAALLVRRGAGRVVLVADPRLLTRAGLVAPAGGARDDNVVFLANVVALHAADGKVYFDEYHHGIRSGGGFWAYLAYHGERWTLLLLLLVVAVAVWRAAVRLGPAVPQVRTAQADAVDYASGLGRLYQRAGARRRLARALARGFLDAMTRHLRLRRTTLPALILAAWRQRNPGARADAPDPTTARLQELLRGVTTLRKGDPTDRDLLTWTKAFDQFLSGVAGRQWSVEKQGNLMAVQGLHAPATDY